MQIVIDISEETYKATCNGCMLPPDVENVVNGIKNGIPIPKGHGDLIDKSEAIISLFDYYSGKKTVGQCIDEVQPIIESDKSESGEA